MKRRDFLRCGAAAAGAFISLDRFPYQLYASDQKKLATDLTSIGSPPPATSRSSPRTYASATAA